MEEFVFNRNIEVSNKDDVHLVFENADIGWGFRVKQESADEKKLALKAGTGKSIK